MKNRVDVSICVVNYKTDPELKRCLESMRKFIGRVSYEVLVIDNSLENRWYSGGNNLAAARANGRYIFFVNPDVYLENDAVSDLVFWMNKHPLAGAIEPLQISGEGDILPTGSLIPKWWIDLIELTGLSKWAPHYAYLLPWSASTRRKCASAGFGRTSGFFQRKNPGPSEENWGIFAGMLRYRMVNKDRRKNWRTEVISGAAMMVRRSVLDKAGVFDERLKLYYTDVDLCRRIMSAGFEIWHVGKVVVRHNTRGSTSKLPWHRVNMIYAQDAREYYRKWKKGAGGQILYGAMTGNAKIIKMLNVIKSLIN